MSDLDEARARIEEIAAQVASAGEMTDVRAMMAQFKQTVAETLLHLQSLIGGTDEFGPVEAAGVQLVNQADQLLGALEAMNQAILQAAAATRLRAQS